MIGDYGRCGKSYAKVWQLNQHLIAEHIKRSNNHEELVAELKKVNLMIQKAKELRVGPPATKLVAAAREALKSNNVQALLKIIKMGAG